MTVAEDEVIIIERMENNEVYEINPDKYVFMANNLLRKKEIITGVHKFEEAIQAVGFGKFNILLYLVTTTTGIAAVFDSLAISYIMTDIRCDLELTLAQEGILNAVTIAGMVTTGFFWGYVSDAIGRRKLLLNVLLLDFMFSLFAALSRHFVLLLLFNFLAGTVTSGAYAALASYLTEMHRKEHRVIVQLFVGFVYGLAELLLPLLAMGLLTKEVPPTLVIYEDFDLLPWNFFLLICSIAPLLGAVGFICLPESPKFLLSRGRNEEAIEVLRYMYRCNKGSCIPYPVIGLEPEGNTESQGLLGLNKSQYSICGLCSEFCYQLKVLFSEYTGSIILVSLIQFTIIFCLDAYKLWMPQLFHEIVQLEENGHSAAVCDALNTFYSPNSTKTCTKAPHLYKEYLYCAIVAAMTLLAFFLSCSAVKGIGKKLLLCFLGYNAGLATILLSYSTEMIPTIALSSVIVPFGNIAFNALISVVTVIFPTSMRALSVAMAMSFGRLGGAIGIFVFPVFLELGCTAPLIFLGSLMIAWSIMITFLPNTESNALK